MSRSPSPSRSTGRASATRPTPSRTVSRAKLPSPALSATSTRPTGSSVGMGLPRSLITRSASPSPSRSPLATRAGCSTCADQVRTPRRNEEVNAAVCHVWSGEYQFGIGNETGVESLHRGDGGAALRSQTNQAFAEAQRAGPAAAERMRDREVLGRATLVPTDDLVHRDTHAERLRLHGLSPGHHLLDDVPPPAARQDIGGWKEVTGAARRAHPGLHLLCTLGFGSRIQCSEPQRDRKYCRERQGNENETAGPSCHSAGSLQRLEVAPHPIAPVHEIPHEIPHEIRPGAQTLRAPAPSRGGFERIDP